MRVFLWRHDMTYMYEYIKINISVVFFPPSSVSRPTGWALLSRLTSTGTSVQSLPQPNVDSQWAASTFNCYSWQPNKAVSHPSPNADTRYGHIPAIVNP